VRISVRFPIGHFRVPNYIRGKRGWIESVIEPPGINNEEELSKNPGRFSACAENIRRHQLKLRTRAVSSRNSAR
jgi:hypothetical protein